MSKKINLYKRLKPRYKSMVKKHLKKSPYLYGDVIADLKSKELVIDLTLGTISYVMFALTISWEEAQAIRNSYFYDLFEKIDYDNAAKS
jgi:hypothetical protein